MAGRWDLESGSFWHLSEEQDSRMPLSEKVRGALTKNKEI